MGSPDLPRGHAQVLADLSASLAGPPVIHVLTGEAGLGKTTLVARATAGWPGPVATVLGGSSQLQVLATLSSLARRSSGGGPPLLIIDDAHDLNDADLAQLGRIGSGPASRHILPGSPHILIVARNTLLDRLAHPRLASLNQSVARRSVLLPMSHSEAEAYLGRWLNQVGAPADAVLDETARQDLLVRSRGNMRRIHTELATCALAAAAPLSQPASQSFLAVKIGDWWRKGGWRGERLAGVGLATVALCLAASFMVFNDGFPVHPIASTERPARATLADIPAEPVIAADGQAPAKDERHPATPASAAIALTPQQQAALPPGVVETLTASGKDSLARGDVTEARRLFTWAAKAGSGPAATALATTYDPDQAAPGSAFPGADAGIALAWYRVAAALGDAAASANVARLERRLQ